MSRCLLTPFASGVNRVRAVAARRVEKIQHAFAFRDLGRRDWVPVFACT